MRIEKTAWPEDRLLLLYPAPCFCSLLLFPQPAPFPWSSPPTPCFYSSHLFPSQILQLTWKSVGGTNPFRADNFSSEAPSLKMWLVPPHMSHIFGFSGMQGRILACQNLRKSIQKSARADLVPPPVCPFAHHQFVRSRNCIFQLGFRTIFISYLRGTFQQLPNAVMWAWGTCYGGWDLWDGIFETFLSHKWTHCWSSKCSSWFKILRLMHNMMYTKK